MKLNLTYIIRFEIGNKILTYFAKVIEIGDLFIKIKDKYGNEINLNKNNIKSYEVVKDDN